MMTRRHGPSNRWKIMMHFYYWVRNGFRKLWRTFSLVVLLSIVATIPILQFASFGYMLESSGRVARGLPIRRCFPGTDVAGRLLIVIGCVAISWLPVWFLTDMAYSAEIIEPGGTIAGRRHVLALVVSILWVVWVLWAIFRGGKIRHFLWPAPLLAFRSLLRPSVWREAEDRLWNFVIALKLPRLLWLGFMASVGAVVWLIVPSVLIGIGLSGDGPGTTLLGLIGAVMMWWVLLYLPFLQIQMAREERFRSVFDRKAIRKSFRQAPWAFFFATAATLLLAVPLYLLRIERVPPQLWWGLSLFFVILMFPAKLYVGWSLRRSAQRAAIVPAKRDVRWAWRWMAWIPQTAVVALYLGVLYLAKFAVWEGAASILLQHAFLPPVPFFIK